MYHFPRIQAFHRETQKEMGIPEDEALWPLSWKIVEYKKYPRFESISLPEAGSVEKPLSSLLLSRSSRRDFDRKKKITTEELASFLFWSFGLKKHKTKSKDSFTRMYPSGGGRYPLEVYLRFHGNDDVEKGLYHYNVKNHSLEKIGSDEEYNAIDSVITYPWVLTAPLHIMVTGMFERSMRKYRERGYRFVLLEAGIVTQNMYLVGEALNLSVCAVGSLFDAKVENALNLKPQLENFLISVVVGKN
jgi:SagB-type dehydrogenase family enzyme